MNAVLNRFAASIPHKPYCSDDLSRGTRVLPRAVALTRRYIQPQISKRLVGWMIFDIDRVGAAFAWEAANLPPPTLTIVNPANAHAHLLYQLKAPVATTMNARMAPMRYLVGIEHAYKLRLGADLGYAGLLTKNPLHNYWRVSTNDVVYDLSLLAEYVDLKRIEPRDSHGLGRNCTLFEDVRKLAYIEVQKHNDFSVFNIEILSICQQFNCGFSEALSEREVKGLATSIAKWTWSHKDEIGEISLIAIDNIKRAALLVCPGVDIVFTCKIAQKEVSRVAGLSVSTIQRFLQYTATKC